MLFFEAFGYSDCCSYIDGPASACGARVKYGSPYCPTHHAVCHIREGSLREQRKLKEFETASHSYVKVVGGEIVLLAPQRSKRSVKRTFQSVTALKGLCRPRPDPLASLLREGR